MSGKAFLSEMEHPLPFVFFITLAVLGMMAVGAYGFKRLGMPGPAAFMQGH